MNHYTYLSTDPADGRMYIGSRSCACEPVKDTNYFGSFKDKTFKPQIKKILKTFNTRKEAFKHEIYLHYVLDVSANPLFANRARATTTGFTWVGQKHTQETKEKIKKSCQNVSVERRMKMSEAAKNRVLTKEHRLKLLQANTGKRHSEETKEKIRVSALNRKLSKETKAKISQHNTGKWVNRPDQSKPITLRNLSTNEIKIFSSQKEAARCIQAHQASISRLATRKQNTCKGWVLN
jgi:hypothetical protein